MNEPAFDYILDRDLYSGVQTAYTEPGFLGDRTPSLLANSTMG